MPGRVLLVAPEAERDPIAAAHRADVHAHLQHLWKKPGPIKLAQNAGEVRDYLRYQSPRLVYWYGPVRQAGQEWRLEIEGGDADGGLSFAQLHECFSTVPPSALFFNLIGEQTAAGFAATAALVEPPGAKFVGCQVFPRGDSTEACRAGIRWLDGVLRDDQRLDPVVALHHNGHRALRRFAACRTGYRLWDPQLGDAQLDDEVAELLLDRSRQRADLARARDELLDLSNKLRVYCLLAGGTAGNRVADFPELGNTDLQIHPREGVHSWLCPIHLPPGGCDLQGLDTLYRRHFGLAPGAAPAEALRPSRRGHAVRILVPLLAWIPAADSTAEQRRATLLTVLEWSRERLALECPRDMRILSLVTLQVDSPEELEDLEEAAEALDERLTSGVEYRRTGSFRFRAMDRLEGVKRKDLSHYFDSEYCTCPDGLRRDYPRLLMQGEREQPFDLTVERIRAASRNWRVMAEKLKREAKK
jgi:hypothetical protein